jgi:hypothetical protein
LPKLIELDKADRKELGQRIADLWTDDNADRDQWLADLPRWIKAYQGRIEDKNVPWEGASNLFVPLTATHVDAIHPRQMAALFQPTPIVSFAAQEPDDDERAKKTERFLDWAVREDCNLFPVLDRTLLNMDVNGIQIIKLYWELKTRHVRAVHEFPADVLPPDAIQAVIAGEQKFIEACQRVDARLVEDIEKNREIELEVEMVGSKLRVTTEREEVVRDAPRAVLIDPEDFVVNSDATYDLQDADHCLHRYWMTFSEIKRMVKRGQFDATKEELDEIELLTAPDRKASDETLEVKETREVVTGTSQVFREGEPARLELIDAYLPYDINDDGEDEEVIVTIVREAPDIVLRVVRLEEIFRHGMRPFTAFYFAPVANTFWAIGIPQILEGIQTELNVIHNQRNDFGTITNTPWGWYVPAAGFNPEKIPIEPGFMIPVDDVNRVKMHQPGNHTAWGFQEEAGLLALAERRTKVNDLTLGRVGETQGAARTASGVQALSAQQATGFDIFIRRIQESFKQLLQQLLALYAQYMPPGKAQRVLGSFGDPDILVTRDDLSGKFDLRFSGNSLSTDREIERQVLTFLTQGAFNPQVMSFLLQLGITTPQGIAEWYHHLFSVFDVPRLDRIVKRPPESAFLTKDAIVNRTVAGERLAPQPGEDHQGVIEALTALLGNPSIAPGLSPESVVAIQEQLGKRQQQMQMEMLAQQMMAMMQPPTPMMQPPALSPGMGAMVPPPMPQRQPVFAR